MTVANVAVLRKDAAVRKDATEKNAAVKNDATMEKDAAMQTDSCEEGLRPRLASSMKTKLARRVYKNTIRQFVRTAWREAENGELSGSCRYEEFNRTPNDAVDARDVNDEGEATQQVVSETENRWIRRCFGGEYSLWGKIKRYSVKPAAFQLQQKRRVLLKANPAVVIADRLLRITRKLDSLWSDFQRG